MNVHHNRTSWFSKSHIKTCGPMVRDVQGIFYCPKCEWRKSGESGNSRWILNRSDKFDRV
jgi:hypothetical protein